MVLSLFSSNLFSDAMQERRITISASIFPRIIAVDQDLNFKNDTSGIVRIGLIYSSDKMKAEKVAELMTRKVNKIAGNKLVFELIDLKKSDLFQYKLSGMFIVEPVSGELLKHLTTHSNQNSILLFSPFEGDVEQGVMAGIFVGAKIQPYFNIKSLNVSKIRLMPALLKVSKKYE